MKGRDAELMQVFDGELEVPGAGGPAARHALSSEDQARLDGLAAVRDTVRAHYQAIADAAGEDLSARLWDGIEAGIEADDRAQAASAAAPVRVAGRRDAREAAGAGWLAWLRDWFESYRGHLVAAAVGAAAGALLVLGLGRPTRIIEREKTVFVPAPAPTQPVVAVRGQGAEVESLEVAGGTGTIFQIPGAGEDAATTVIWINRDHGGPEESI